MSFFMRIMSLRWHCWDSFIEVKFLGLRPWDLILDMLPLGSYSCRNMQDTLKHIFGNMSMELWPWEYYVALALIGMLNCLTEYPQLGRLEPEKNYSTSRTVLIVFYYLDSSLCLTVMLCSDDKIGRNHSKNGWRQLLSYLPNYAWTLYYF